jgi:hypothetical protein
VQHIQHKVLTQEVLLITAQPPSTSQVFKHPPVCTACPAWHYLALCCGQSARQAVVTEPAALIMVAVTATTDWRPTHAVAAIRRSPAMHVNHALACSNVHRMTAPQPDLCYAINPTTALRWGSQNPSRLTLYTPCQ